MIFKDIPNYIIDQKIVFMDNGETYEVQIAIDKITLAMFKGGATSSPISIFDMMNKLGVRSELQKRIFDEMFHSGLINGKPQLKNPTVILTSKGQALVQKTNREYLERFGESIFEKSEVAIKTYTDKEIEKEAIDIIRKQGKVGMRYLIQHKLGLEYDANRADNIISKLIATNKYQEYQGHTSSDRFVRKNPQYSSDLRSKRSFWISILAVLISLVTLVLKLFDIT